MLVMMAACGSRAPAGSGVAPAAPRPIHAEVRDSSVDAVVDERVLTSPDMVSAVVDVAPDALMFKLRLRPGTFDAATTRFAIDLDTDQNGSTGASGVEYYVFIFPEGGKGADVARTMGTSYAVVGTVPVSFVADGCDVTIPLAMVGNDDGRFDFRVRVLAQPALPVVFDSVPDVGFVRVQ